MFHYLIHKSTALNSVQNHLNPAQNLTSYLFKIHFSIILQSVPVPPSKIIFPSGLPAEISYVLLIPHMYYMSHLFRPPWNRYANHIL
jgi:hypothetical protein